MLALHQEVHSRKLLDHLEARENDLPKVTSSLPLRSFTTSTAKREGSSALSPINEVKHSFSLPGAVKQCIIALPDHNRILSGRKGLLSLKNEQARKNEGFKHVKFNGSPKQGRLALVDTKL